MSEKGEGLVPERGLSALFVTRVVLFQIVWKLIDLGTKRYADLSEYYRGFHEKGT